MDDIESEGDPTPKQTKILVRTTADFDKTCKAYIPSGQIRREVVRNEDNL